MPSILQDWVQGIGLRHQGVLLTAVRGCDTAPKDDPSKLFTRYLRGMILKAHCGDPRKAQTFIVGIDWTDRGDVQKVHDAFHKFRKDCDHYPHHYLMHVIHAIEVVGYKHPEPHGEHWRMFYVALCTGLHMTPETKAEMDERLNLDEDAFGKRNKA